MGDTFLSATFPDNLILKSPYNKNQFERKTKIRDNSKFNLVRKEGFLWKH